MTTRYLHTMYRITNPERSRAFYEALGFEFRREMDIHRDGGKGSRPSASRTASARAARGSASSATRMASFVH